MAHTKKKIYIIVNPVSGKSKQKKQKLSEYAFSSLDPHQYDVHFMFTRSSSKIAFVFTANC